jgi:hypothetical protein
LTRHTRRNIAILKHRRTLFGLFISIKTGEIRLLRRGVLFLVWKIFSASAFGLEPASLGVVSGLLTDGARDDDLTIILATLVRSSSFALSVTISVRRDSVATGTELAAVGK